MRIRLRGEKHMPIRVFHVDAESYRTVRQLRRAVLAQTERDPAERD